ncbi:MAG: DUF4394 domain-containing protein [Thermoleophilaceae bacterium]
MTVTALAAPSAASAAEELAAVTNSNKVLTFASDSPGNLDSAFPIAGLPSGEKIVGIDTRPATGQLYALGKSGRIYVLDPSSGASRAVTGPISPVPSGSYFGFNFNPTVDRIRITSDTRQNLRVDPDTGATAVDTPLAYAPGQGAGATPQVGGVAYTNPVPTATTTEQYGLEGARNSLVLVNPPNSGTLSTRGNGLGQELNGPSGFDISASNVGWSSYKVNNAGAVNLYRLDLGAGTARNATSQAGIGTRAAADDTIAIASLGSVSDDKSAPKIVADVPTSASRVNLSRGRSFFATVGLNESGRVQVDMRVGSRLVAQGKGEIFTRAGAVKIRIKATSAGQSILKRKYRKATIKFSARDRAGNLKKNSAKSFTLR